MSDGIWIKTRWEGRKMGRFGDESADGTFERNKGK